MKKELLRKLSIIAFFTYQILGYAYPAYGENNWLLEWKSGLGAETGSFDARIGGRRVTFNRDNPLMCPPYEKVRVTNETHTYNRTPTLPVADYTTFSLNRTIYECKECHQIKRDFESFEDQLLSRAPWVPAQFNLYLAAEESAGKRLRTYRLFWEKDFHGRNDFQLIGPCRAITMRNLTEGSQKWMALSLPLRKLVLNAGVMVANEWDGSGKPVNFSIAGSWYDLLLKTLHLAYMLDSGALNEADLKQTPVKPTCRCCLETESCCSVQ